MLYVRYDKSDKQNQTKYSAFVSFQYNPYYVEKIRGLPLRYWHLDKKEWEIPISLIPRLKEIDNNIKELNQLQEEHKTVDGFQFKTTPYKHQIEGVEYGINANSWLLGDQQGLGKTKQMIDLAVWKKQNEGIKHVLIICGINNLKYNWADEIETHSNENYCILGKRFCKNNKAEPSMQNRLDDVQNEPSEFFWITNIETLRCFKEGRFYKSEIVNFLNYYISNGELSLIIVDEVHKAKNPTSAQGRGLLKLKGCPKIGLSGTLLVNNPLDLYMPLTLIDAISMPYFSYQQRYTVKDMWGHPIGWKNTDELKVLMNEHMLRRTKDLLDLPEKISVVEKIEMSKEEKRLYNEILNATKKECDKISNPVQVLPKLIRMRQVCCHTSLVSSTVCKSSKFERLNDILEEAKLNNEKVIVFSMFRELVELALEEFKNYKPLHIYGGMNQIELQEQKNQFQNGEGFQAIFGVMQAAGTGITLNSASHVVFLDLPWNRATMEQAEDRAHRIGTKRTVIVHILLMDDSYDSVLYDKVISKGALADILVDGKNYSEFKNVLKCIFKEKGEFE